MKSNRKAKKEAVKQQKVSKSSLPIAEFLLAKYPKDATKIVAGMKSAATNKSMRRKLGRVEEAIASASASASASAAA
jgi:hypothetical protein